MGDNIKHNVSYPFARNVIESLKTSNYSAISGTGVGSSYSDYVFYNNTAGQFQIGGSELHLGSNAGAVSQKSFAVALGAAAGQTAQGTNSVAVGYRAGQNTQLAQAVAVGYQAGQTNQGQNCVAIGALAGQSSQYTGSIALNASGSALNPDQAGLFINPVRGTATATPVVVYNSTTKELTYNTSSRKYKDNIENLSDDTGTVLNLQPRQYRSKIDGKEYVGLIAEESNDANPHFAWKEKGEPEGIEWFNILLYLVAEVKKLKNKVDELENK